jgi:hypothetical protein
MNLICFSSIFLGKWEVWGFWGKLWQIIAISKCSKKLHGISKIFEKLPRISQEKNIPKLS